MAKPRSTIARDSVFRPSDTPARLPRQGAPKVERLTHQTAVWLSDEETDWIDERCKQVRKGGWRGVTRSAFIRSLIQAHLEEAFDFDDVADERELVRRLRPTDYPHSPADQPG